MVKCNSSPAVVLIASSCRLSCAVCVVVGDVVVCKYPLGSTVVEVCPPVVQSLVLTVIFDLVTIPE
jgi:hypothetical protein